MAVPLGSAMQTLNQGSVLEEYDTDREVFRQRFRQFQYEEAAGPRDAFKKLSELCRQWLKPNLGCLEEILEVLVLEQLMQILPIEIQNCTRQFSMKNREALFSLIEFLQTKTDVSEQQVDRQEVLLEALAPVGTAHIPPDIHLESPPVQVMGPAPEAPVAEACIPQGGPQELSYGAAGECQPFLDPGQEALHSDRVDNIRCSRQEKRCRRHLANAEREDPEHKGSCRCLLPLTATQRNKLELRLQAPAKSSAVGRDMAVPLGSAMQTLNQGSVLEEYDTDREVFRQRFRQFQYEEAAGPRDAFKKLSELCRQWLKPNLGCLEEILEVLVLEQLMQILPIEIQNCTRQFSMKNREALFSLIEFLQTKTDVSEQQVDRQEVLLEALAPVGTAHIPPDIHLESPPVQVMGPAPEAPVAEACIPQGGPQELSYGAAGECQPFLDPEEKPCQVEKLHGDLGSTRNAGSLLRE
ncbi:hypothetical protein MUG91_G1061n1 [Manis pentadactyla]|nr:hypothetical protein MUG91_G1061n1 [Manis pentadactyla]